VRINEPCAATWHISPKARPSPKRGCYPFTALIQPGGNLDARTRRDCTADIEINKIFRLIRDDVMEAAAGRQEPFTYGSLPGREDFFFVATR